VREAPTRTRLLAEAPVKTSKQGTPVSLDMSHRPAPSHAPPSLPAKQGHLSFSVTNNLNVGHMH
jgi:hypothetical protein